MERRKPRVLIIEDDEYSSEALEHLLNAEGYEACVAADAVSGYCSARRSRPDIIVLDLGLPDFDGRRLIEKLRGNRVLREVPILVVTGESLATLPSAADLGADYYLTKPVTFDDFSQAIFKLKNELDARPDAAGTQESQ